jgi:hypothetical protein
MSNSEYIMLIGIGAVSCRRPCGDEFVAQALSAMMAGNKIKLLMRMNNLYKTNAGFKIISDKRKGLSAPCIERGRTSMNTNEIIFQKINLYYSYG